MEPSSTFPADKYEALTMLLLSQQNLTQLPASNLLKKYNEIHDALLEADGHDPDFGAQVIG